MNGHDHALFGLAGYGAALIVGVERLDLALPATEVVALGAAVAVGASLAADIDERHSIASQGAGLFGSLARIITSAGGGHRTVTHYPLLWVGGLTLLCWALISGSVGGRWLAVLLGVLTALGVPFVIGPKRRSKLGPLLDVVVVAVAVGVGMAVTRWGITADWWLYAAVPVPYLAHLIGDTPTPAGVPWLFPLSSSRFGVGLFHSGAAFERLVVSPLLVLACGWCIWRLYELGAFTL